MCTGMENIVFTFIPLALHFFRIKTMVSSVREMVEPLQRQTQVTQEGCLTSALNDKERSLYCSQEESGKERGVAEGQIFWGQV